MSRPPVPIPAPAVARLSLQSLISTSSGGEVLVPAGTYRERLVLDRPVVLTAADGPGTVRLQVESGPALILRGDAALRGFLIEVSDPANPAVLVEAGSPRFDECEFRGARVETTGNSTPRFRRCEFRRCALAGLHAVGRSGPRLEECGFHRVAGHAVVAGDSAKPVLAKGRIIEAEGAGIRLVGEAFAAIDGLVVTGSRGPGLVVGESAGAVVRQCGFLDSAAEGVRVDGSAPFAGTGAEADRRGAYDRPGRPGGVTIEDCLIARSALEGLVAAAGAIRLMRVKVSQARRTGMLIGGTAEIESRECVVLDCAAHGAEVRGAARLRAVRMSVVNCGASALVLAQDAVSELVDGEYSETVSTLVQVAGRSTLVARGSMFAAGREHGIRALDSAMVELESCTVRDCEGDAIRVEARANATLRECRVERVRFGVILAAKYHHPLLEGCTITETAKAGIVVGKACRPLLLGCEVRGAGTVGVLHDDQSAAVLDGVRVDGAGEHGMVVGAAARPRARRIVVAEANGFGIRFRDGALGEFEDCVLSGGSGPVDLAAGAAPRLVSCGVTDPG